MQKKDIKVGQAYGYAYRRRDPSLGTFDKFVVTGFTEDTLRGRKVTMVSGLLHERRDEDPRARNVRTSDLHMPWAEVEERRINERDREKRAAEKAAEVKRLQEPMVTRIKAVLAEAKIQVTPWHLARRELRTREIVALDSIKGEGIDMRKQHKTEPAWDDPLRCPAIQYSEGWHNDPDRYYMCRLGKGHDGRHITRVGSIEGPGWGAMRPERMEVAISVRVPEDKVEQIVNWLTGLDKTRPLEPTMYWTANGQPVIF